MCESCEKTFIWHVAGKLILILTVVCTIAVVLA